MQKKNRIKSTKTTFTIIEQLIDLEGAGVTELARHLDIPKSTVYSHLNTLHDLGYVAKQDDQYRASLRLLDLGERTRSQIPLYYTAKPELQNLAEDTGEHASLLVQEQDQVVILETVNGSHSVRIDTHSGLRLIMQSSAPGKAILAFLPEDQVEQIIDHYGFQQLTENTITDREELFEELAEIREQKYCLDDGERMEGMRAIAVPILDKKKNPLGALTVYGPTSRITEDRFRNVLPEKLLVAANVIELNINYD